MPVADLTCGLYVAIAVLAALRERETSGQGQYVDVSLLESAVSLAVWEAGRYWATGEVGGPLGSAHQSQAPYQAVPTVGRVADPRRHHARRPGPACAPSWVSTSSSTTRGSAPRPSGTAGRDELLPIVEERTRQHPTGELVERLEAAGVPCAPIATYDEVFTDAHLGARDFYWDAPHPPPGRSARSGRRCGSPARRRPAPTPARGSGGTLVQVLREAGLDDARVDALLASGAAAEVRG